MIHSKKALSLHWARKFYKNFTTEKTYYSIASRGQTDFYDNPFIVNECVRIITNYFQESAK